VPNLVPAEHKRFFGGRNFGGNTIQRFWVDAVRERQKNWQAMKSNTEKRVREI